MEHEDLNRLKKKYLETPIPDKLEFLVKKTLTENVNKMKRKNFYRRTGIAAASIAVSTVMLTVGINSSTTFASTLSNVPLVGGIVKVLTFKEYKVNEDTFNANIEVPSIEGLDNKVLEKNLNEKYLAENKELYEEFIADMGSLKEAGGGHLGVDSGYIVKTDTDKLLSIGRYVVNTVGSSSTEFKYDTIDKEEEILITLPSLFKNSSYVEIISENIIAQMNEQMESDENKVYWIEGHVEDGFVEPFERIAKDQNFYISNEGKLVISFDKYEVAPGYMGVLEFIIPTDSISDILVGNDYIK